MKEENKKNEIIFAHKYLRKNEMEKIMSGYYDALISIKIDNVVKEFNKGNYEVLDSEDTVKFLTDMVKPTDILELIYQAENFINQKGKLDTIVSNLKDRFNYNPDDAFYTSRNNAAKDDIYTYKDIYDSIEFAKKFVNDKKVYQLLRYLYKYYNLVDIIKQRKQLMKVVKDSSDTRNVLLEKMAKADKKVGIIKVDDSKYGTRIVAGNQAEMEFSDVVGEPFTPDMDEEGYWYGHYDDYYMPPRKVVKTFHGEGDTNNHKKMIEAENRKRFLIEYDDDIFEKGFIKNGDFAIIISKQELLRYGINPDRVNWKPLKITYKPVRLIKKMNMDSIKEAISIGHRLILK